MSVSPTSSSYSASGSYQSPLAMSGLATGMDTSTIIQELMSIAKQPVVNLQNQQTTDNNKLSTYRDLNTKLSALQTAANNLTGVDFNTSPLASMSATAGNTALFSATASNGSTAGTYTVNITQLATAETGIFVPPTSSAGGSFQINGATVNVNAGDSATQIAAAINANTATGVSAAVVTDSGGTQNLILTGQSTGTNYTLSDPSGLLGTGTTTSAQKAQATIDGIAVSSNTNTFSNIVNGVDLTASATGSSTLTVAA
ncbi:MAG TPA: flagellar cap protein FliD N-terminal domain-containing protein, partial [Oscillatoriaceae cyanobacterium]